jgi:hypothetical protein
MNLCVQFLILCNIRYIEVARGNVISPFQNLLPHFVLINLLTLLLLKQILTNLRKSKYELGQYKFDPEGLNVLIFASENEQMHQLYLIVFLQIYAFPIVSQ